MLIKLLAQTKLLFKPISVLPVYRFCSEQNQTSNQAQDGEIDKAGTFYRNSVRRINVNAQGRGKFTEHHLIKLTKLTENDSQVPLLFEAYYNYLGHFTVFSNRTVDKMLEKAMSFDQVPLNLVFQVFQNHNYLAYFPHYRITERFIDLAAEKDEKLFQKLLKVFMFCPLIKFDQAIVDKLVGMLSKQSILKGTFSMISKVLMQRSSFQLIDDYISPTDLAKTINSALQSRQEDASFKKIRPNQYVVSFFNKVREGNPDLQQLGFLQQVFSKAEEGEAEAEPAAENSEQQ